MQGEAPVQYQISRDADTTVLHLRHHLAHSDRRQFIELIPDLLGGGPRRLIIDLKDLRFLDSAGLGMLLALKDAAEKDGASMSLRDPVASVLTLLKLSKMETIVPIEHS